MFGFGKKSVADLGNQLKGRKDLLEAGAAFGALIAGADGNLAQDEQDACVKAIKSNAALAAAYTANDIEQSVAKMFDKADGGTRSGKVALWKEIDEVIAKGNADDTMIVFVIGLDVADKGGIDAKEQEVITKAEGKFGLKASDFAV